MGEEKGDVKYVDLETFSKGKEVDLVYSIIILHSYITSLMIRPEENIKDITNSIETLRIVMEVKIDFTDEILIKEKAIVKEIEQTFSVMKKEIKSSNPSLYQKEVTKLELDKSIQTARSLWKFYLNLLKRNGLAGEIDLINHED